MEKAYLAGSGEINILLVIGFARIAIPRSVWKAAWRVWRRLKRGKRGGPQSLDSLAAVGRWNPTIIVMPPIAPGPSSGRCVIL